MSSHDQSLVFYDGECGICNQSMQTIWKNDPKGYFHFSPLQSDFAQEFLRTHGVSELSFDTIYVYDQGSLYERSLALAQISSHLQGRGFHFCAWFIKAFPIRSWADALYNCLARNRQRFPAKKACILPSAEIRARFKD